MGIKNFRLANSSLLRMMSIVNKFERTCNWVMLKGYNFNIVDHSEESKKNLEVIMTASPLLQEEKRQLKEARERCKANRNDAEYQMRFLCKDVLDLKTNQEMRHLLMREHLPGGNK